MPFWSAQGISKQLQQRTDPTKRLIPRYLKETQEATLTLLLLGRINHNPIQIRTLDILPVIQTPNSNSVLSLLERQQQRS